MYAVLSRYKAHPITLIRCRKENPVLLSSCVSYSRASFVNNFTIPSIIFQIHLCSNLHSHIFAFKNRYATLHIAISRAKFSCCERNHVDNRECEREVATSVLNTLHKAKVLHLYSNSEFTMGRIFACFKAWWFRGLNSNRVEGIVEEDKEEDSENKSERVVNSFKRELRWDQESDHFFDGHGISTLIYAVIRNDENTVRHILFSVSQTKDSSHKLTCLSSRVPSNVFRDFGLFKGSTALSVAASFASVKIVEMLLEMGCDIKGTIHNISARSSTQRSTYTHTHIISI